MGRERKKALSSGGSQMTLLSEERILRLRKERIYYAVHKKRTINLKENDDSA